MKRTILLAGLLVAAAFSMVSFSRAAVIVAGVDTVPLSTAQMTIEIFPNLFFPAGFVEVTNLNSGPFDIHRQTQQGDGSGTVNDFIDTEILDLTLTGTSVNVGPFSVRIGAANGVQEAPTLGQVTNVVSAPIGTFDPVGPGAFVIGDSFFDVFFEIDVVVSGNPMTFYNRDPHVLEAPGITELPPVDTHFPPFQSVPIYWRLGATNSLGDPLIGAVLGDHTTLIPEPTTFALAAMSVLSLGCVVWRRRRRAGASVRHVAHI